MTPRAVPSLSPATSLAALASHHGVLSLTGCNLREYAIDRAVEEQVHYVPDAEHLAGYELTKLTDRVYTFRWTWDRSIVVLTDEGVVVFDPMNAQAARHPGQGLEQ